MCALTRLYHSQTDHTHTHTTGSIEAVIWLITMPENAPHIYLPLKQRQPRKSRGRYNANVGRGLFLTSPSHCKDAAPRDSHGSARSLPPGAPYTRIHPSLHTFARCVFGDRREEKIKSAWNRKKKNKRKKNRRRSRPRHICSPQSLRANGPNGYHGLNASESEEAAASNQFRGWVRARVPQAAPDPIGGGWAPGDRADVRRPRRAGARRVSQAEWPLGDSISDLRDAGAGKRVKVRYSLGRWETGRDEGRVEGKQK